MSHITFQYSLFYFSVGAGRLRRRTSGGLPEWHYGTGAQCGEEAFEI